MIKVKKGVIVVGVAAVLATILAIVLGRKAKAAAPPTPPPPSPGKATLYGNVTDSETGSAVAGALLTLDSFQNSTDTGGNYTFSDVETGSFNITVEQTGYNTFSQSVTLTEGSYQLNIQLVPVAVPPSAADIRLESLGISPVQVTVEEKVIILVTATNYGSASGSKTITLTFDGITSSQTVTLAPNQSQQITFEVTPHEAKTYNVSVDGLAGNFTAVPVVPPAVILQFKGIEVHSLNDIPFSETGYGDISYPCQSCQGTGKIPYIYTPNGWIPSPTIPPPPGYQVKYLDCPTCGGTGELHVTGTWARLSQPIIKSTLRGAVTIKGRNKTITFISDENYNAIYAYVFYQMWGGPSFQGYGTVPWVKQENFKVAAAPWDFQITPGGVIGAGSWKPKLYSARVQIGGVYFDGAGTNPFCQFYVLDFLQCTGSGSV